MIKIGEKVIFYIYELKIIKNYTMRAHTPHHFAICF